MADLADLATKVTYRVDLPGGQKRLKEATMYVIDRASGFAYLGRVKLNKILWRADFRSYHDRLLPVTGRQYQVLQNGPAPYEMVPILNDLQQDGAIEFVPSDVPNEQRPILKKNLPIQYLKKLDQDFLDESIEHYRLMTATQASKESHGLAWRTHSAGDPIPYEASIFNDDITPERLPSKLENRFHELARSKNLHSA